MPYKIVKSGGGYKVRKKSGGKWAGSKKPMSKEKAKRQMAAIYANEQFESRINTILENL